MLAGREAVEALRHDGRMIVNRRMLWKRCVLAAVVAVTVGALGPVGSARADGSPPFRNPDLPLSVRVDDLVSRLTLDEKISLLHQYEPAIPRLGVPAFRIRVGFVVRPLTNGFAYISNMPLCPRRRQES